MWCSSFGASTDLPCTMELNVFINTFELITEVRLPAAPSPLLSRAIACARRQRVSYSAPTLTAARLRLAPRDIASPCSATLALAAARISRSASRPYRPLPPIQERHTLAMAHLTGGETIAFEMVQALPPPQ